jgi:hypothetical protein
MSPSSFTLFASPWFVNILILVPVAVYLYWRRNPLRISNSTLFYATIFGIAFGYIEAAVVVHIRASMGLLPGFMGTLADVQKAALSGTYSQAVQLPMMPESLFTVESIRNAMTIIMISAVAALAVDKMKERFAMFLWIFAFWDIFYYIFLWGTVRWPQSLLTRDVLFLIPVLWISQVWFPILVSSACLLAILLTNNRKELKKGKK